MVVQAFLTMLPRLDAGERLGAIGDGAVAAGALERFDAMRAVRALEEARDGRRQPPAKATPAVLAGMGIGVARQPLAASKAVMKDA